MNRLLTRAAAATLAAAAGAAFAPQAAALGWPENYQGVMLQGFYWDSYADTRWTNLQSQADELSQSFSLIWIPNSGRCGSSDNMGYMPQYWFTNHNSSFGTEAELLSMISTFKSKGVGMIADCVINHRNGVTDWTDFPSEEWNGRTWHIGPEGICRTDEVNGQPGQATPTGAADTGDDFNGARDLDHTDANVQDNCRNYVRCLIEKYGYSGMRYDMVKGYGGQYTGIYNRYADVTYSVGEYWDASYDAVAAWIDATGKTSAAFDFPCKYAINSAFSSGDMTRLVWKANGTTDQPAGMIHFGYPRYAVTFVDNHDTYRDGSRFTGNVVAANAFILFSPGTPCIFLPHWKACKAEIKRLIAIRNAVGIHNQSAVRVLRSQPDCYMAEITGANGKAVVKIGPAMVSPDGYADSDIKAAGNDYCVWTTTDVGGGDDPDISMPRQLFVIGEVDGHGWSPDAGVEMTRYDHGFYATVDLAGTLPGATDGYFSLAENLASTWDDLNAPGNRFAPAADTPLVLDGDAIPFAACSDGNNAKAFYAPDGRYDILVDWTARTVSLRRAGSVGTDGIGPDDSDCTPERWFNMQGCPVTAPDKGLYIRVRGLKSEKILL